MCLQFVEFDHLPLSLEKCWPLGQGKANCSKLVSSSQNEIITEILS